MSKIKLFWQFVRPYPIRLILTIILGFSGALFNGVGTTLIVPVVLKFLGQEVQFQNAPPLLQLFLNPFSNFPVAYQLPLMTGAIVLAITLKNLTSYLGSLASGSLSRTLMADLREVGIQLLLDVDLDFYSKSRVGDLLNKLGGEVSRTATAINTLIGMFTTSITVFVFLVLLIAISWKLTLASTILLSIVTFSNQFIIRRSKQFGKKLSQASKAYSVGLLETLNGIRLVKSMANETSEFSRLKTLIRDFEKASFENQINEAALGPINEVVSIIVILLIVGLGRLFFAEQIDSLSTVLLTYLFVLFRLLPLISNLNGSRSRFANSSAGVDIVAELLRRDNKPFMKSGNLPFTSLERGIQFENVSFAYPGQNTYVLKNINLYIPSGTTLALVGGSGAGKSTLADLIPRFYDPNEGAITIDGVDLRDFDLRSLRRRMGIVSQETFLFNTSVKNNIAYARKNVTDEEILAAAERANAYEFIGQLSQGFYTHIGDRGVLLSGGQRQRISIARALVQNPEILILDEATSALDTVSERLVQEAIEELSRERTTIVIAHRLSTIQQADQIAVLDQGNLVELGTHDELLAKGGYYARLYTLQFSEEAARDRAVIRSSFRVRSYLSPMIGCLKLLLDDLIDSPREQTELLEESYHYATQILNSLEFLEDTVKLQLREKNSIDDTFSDS